MKKRPMLFVAALLLAFSAVPAWPQTAKPTPTKEQIEAIKAQTAKATAINALITQYQNAANAKNWQEAIAPLKQLLEIDPERWEYYQALGDMQLNLAQYREAADTYEKGIDKAGQASGPNVDQAKVNAAISQMLTNQGNGYLKMGQTNQAMAAYARAAEMAPSPGVAYFNLCATQYNLGQMKAAALSCDKSIAADPSRADAYFIKGSALYGDGNLDAQGKYIVPPGTVEALKKYLELAPEGSHAADVKAMLEAIGVKIETTFSPRKK